MDWIEWCSNRSKCIQNKYYDSDDSCLYTTKPCKEFSSPVPCETITKIVNYISSFDAKSLSVTIDEQSKTVTVSASIGRYESLIIEFDFEGNILSETVYD